MTDRTVASVESLGSDVRRRRLELGLSQSRLAETLGVPPTQIGRWERGDETPGPRQLQSLARALDLDEAEAAAWLDDGSTLSVEIIGGSHRDLPPPLAPPIGPDAADPGGLPVGGQDEADSAAVVPLPDERPPASAGRAFRRQARLDKRRIKRELTAARRGAREQKTREVRRRREAESAARRTGALPMLEPGHAPAPPAGAANTGSVFPVPDTRHSSERVTYRARHAAPNSDRKRYSWRTALTVAIMLALIGTLIWALGALGDGIGAVFDLFRGEDVPDPGAAALRWAGRGG
jgi:transcriptional regulator with XRE-family HTH domain